MNAIRTTLPGGWRAVFWLSDPQNESALREFLTKLIADPARLPGYASLKYSASGEVLRADGPPGSGMAQVVCKLSRASTLGRLLPSRARKNARRAQVLRSAGINTPQPLALLERGRESWLITKYLPDLIDLDQFALAMLPRMERQESHRWKTKGIGRVVDLFARVMQSGLHHRDLKASNILLYGVRATNSDMDCIILDLDGLRTWVPGHRTAERARLTRLAASLLQYRSITRPDYVRFLRTYLQTTGRDAEHWRTWFRELGQHASDYNRRARTRKADKLDGYAG